MNLKIKFNLLLVVLSAIILVGCTSTNEGAVPDIQEDLEPTIQEEVDESIEEEDDLDEIFEESNFDDDDVEIGELI